MSKLEKWMDDNNVHSFEGDKGLENLNKLCLAMGYTQGPFKYGSPLEQFLSDNPGAIETLVNWADENIADELLDEDEDEDE